MKNKFSLLKIAVIILVGLGSCKKPAPELAAFIPKDAGIVLSVNPKSITDKLSSSGITIDSLASVFEDRDHDYALHWSDIKNSGIDLDNPFYLFNKQSNSMQAGPMEISGFIAPVKDKNKLAAFLKKRTDDEHINSESKYQYVILNDRSVAGWTDKVLIISSVRSGGSGMKDDSLSHQQLTALFTQSQSSSVASIDAFNNMLKKTGDIHFWSNASASFGSLGMFGMMTKVNTLVQDTYTEGTIDFQNGKAIASVESHLNKTLADMIKKYPAREIDKTMITQFPNPANGFAIAAFDPKLLVDIFHYLGVDAMAQGYTSQMGFNMDDVASAFKGDIAMIFTDFNVNTEPSAQMPGLDARKLGSQFLLNARIGDRTAFDKVMTGLVNQHLLSRNGNQYELGFFGGHGFVIETVNDNFFVASDQALIQAYQSGKKSALAPDVDKEISNKSGAAYFDLAALLNKSNYADESERKTLEAAKSTFKNFIAVKEKGEGSETKGSLELNTVNKNENSLASIAKFLTIARQEGELRRKNVELHPPVPPALNDEPQSDSGEQDQ